ncbi:hypothetical protein Ciccas_007796 [Cichlidogyrus casuarinus]|uniref:Receptor protein-tyrosine kinase n=1 Tax=Cichlidogyrus casuarinus TaxID=1844966 RepID=A0ABD2Q300_9PLAT
MSSLVIQNIKAESIELPSLIKITNNRPITKIFSFLNNDLRYLSIPNLEEIDGSVEISGTYPSYFDQLDLSPIILQHNGHFTKQKMKTFEISDQLHCKQDCASGSFWPSPKCECVKTIDKNARQALKDESEFPPSLIIILTTDDSSDMCRLSSETGECSVCLGGLRLQDHECVTECNKRRYSFLDTFCLGECPKNTFQVVKDKIRSCELSCAEGHLITAENMCIPCPNLDCTERKHCSYLRGKTTKNVYNISEVLHRIDSFNCSVFYGELNLASYTLRELGSHVLERLQVLKKVQVIYGALQIDFHNGLMPSISNLSFLENLQKIYFDQDSTNMLTSLDLDLRNSSLQYLGLRSLKYVDSDKGIDLNVDQTRDHCFVTPFCQNTENFSLNSLLFNQSSCEALKSRCSCHPACAAKYGCWGPGPSQCFACCNFRAGDKCVESCAEESGYYQRPGTKSANLCSPAVDITFHKDVHCRKCHDECSAGCSGAGANQCIGGCRHFTNNGVCVPTCPGNMFSDERGFCQQCSAHCKGGCTGTGSWLGDGGCHECSALLPDGLTCTSTCPNGTYSTAMDKSVRCNLCHSNCDVCIDNGSSKQSCIKCRFAFHNDSCVHECPTSKRLLFISTLSIDYFTKELEDGNRFCTECHSQCFDGCSDSSPSACFKCRHKALVFANRVSLLCLSSESADLFFSLEYVGFAHSNNHSTFAKTLNERAHDHDLVSEIQKSIVSCSRVSRRL